MDQRLETFLTVCATMNYRKAAEQLHLTQPAVTKQIQALEALYGVRLFTYDSRKLRKTPQGETLEIYAISQRYQDEELRRALKRQEKTSLRIGATKSIGDYILLPQIIRFLKEPDNELFFPSTIRHTCSPSSRAVSLTSSCSRAFSTRAGTRAFCCATSPTSASARKITRFRAVRCRWMSSFPSGSSCASLAPVRERF